MIPISTDAPIYHWPIATVSTIVLNVICFWAFCLNIESEQVQLVAPDGHVILTEDQLISELKQFKTQAEAERYLESLTPRNSGWGQPLCLQFGSFKPWQWVTNNFMHMGLGHLVGNMIFLWAFG